MTPDTRKIKIQQMLEKSGNKIGIAPVSQDHIERVERMLQAKGLFKKEDTPYNKKQKTIKSIIKSWTLKHLKMEHEEWESIEITEIIMNHNSDISFITCKTKEDITKCTSKVTNLPRDKGTETPRVIMYVDQRATKRHRAYQNIAKTIRDTSKNEIQTSIRIGK